MSWNNPYIVASGVRRCGFYSAPNTTAFGPTVPSSVTDLREAPLDSVMHRPVNWSFAMAAHGHQLLGWRANGMNVTVRLPRYISLGLVSIIRCCVCCGNAIDGGDTIGWLSCRLVTMKVLNPHWFCFLGTVCI